MNLNPYVSTGSKDYDNLEDVPKTCTVTPNGLQASGECKTDEDAMKMAARKMKRILEPPVAVLEEPIVNADTK